MYVAKGRIDNNRRHAIILINADPVHWRIYAAQGGDELIKTIKT